jgi:hypothetical protein
MAESCCQFVGNLKFNINACIISVSTSCSVDSGSVCGVSGGNRSKTVSVSAYAGNSVWIGCSAKAGVSIPHIQKYDCERDITHFLHSGDGQSYTFGSLKGIAYVQKVLQTCEIISANSSSGPSGIYSRDIQTNGTGLVYLGGPFNFSSSSRVRISIPGIGGGYLQSFSFEAQPGQIPVANYSLVDSL